MWMSKKKMEQMMAEAVEREREKEMLYRFMDETHVMLRKLEDKIAELEHFVYSKPSVGKKQLNG